MERKKSPEEVAEELVSKAITLISGKNPCFTRNQCLTDMSNSLALINRLKRGDCP